MTDSASHFTHDAEDVVPAGYAGWRRVHLTASWLVTGVGVAHCVVAWLLHDAWTAEAVWFLGTGLGIVFVGTLNLAHIGLSPCRMPTVRFVHWVNVFYALFAIAALWAVPEPQTVVLVITLVAQVVAGRITLPGPG